MKRILLSLMMLSVSSSLCHAQKIKFEYDDRGNVVKRYVPPSRTEEHTYNGYTIKLTFDYSGNKMNVKFLDGYTRLVKDCHIEITIQSIVYGYIQPVKMTSEKGDFDVDITSLSKDYWYLGVYAKPDPQKTPVVTTIKFLKK